MKQNITICVFGEVDGFPSASKLRKLKSSLFCINDIQSGIRPPFKADSGLWSFSDQSLLSKLESKHGDLVIGFCDFELEGHFYTRILSERIAIVSFTPVADYIKNENIPLFNFVVRQIYALSLFKKINQNKLDFNLGIQLSSDSTEGCIFDMNPFLYTITRSLKQLRISDTTKDILKTGFSISQTEIDTINRELSKYKKPYINRIESYLRKNVLANMFISLILGFLLGILGTVFR